MKTVSVIIPTYNDTRYLASIVSAISKSKYTKQILVINDGSTLKLPKLNGARVITHKYNQGKTAALYTGFKHANGKVICFIDADLINFSTQYFDYLVSPVVLGSLDCTMSIRGKEAWYGRVTGIADVFTGERAITKSLLTQNLKIFDGKGYIFEALFNQIFFGKINLKGVYMPKLSQPNQASKKGIKGWVINTHQVLNFIAKLGLLEVIKQLLFVKKASYKL